MAKQEEIIGTLESQIKALLAATSFDWKKLRELSELSGYKWVTNFNTPGCLPDGEPEWSETQSEAFKSLLFSARQHADEVTQDEEEYQELSDEIESWKFVDGEDFAVNFLGTVYFISKDTPSEFDEELFEQLKGEVAPFEDELDFNRALFLLLQQPILTFNTAWQCSYTFYDTSVVIGYRFGDLTPFVDLAEYGIIEELPDLVKLFIKATADVLDEYALPEQLGHRAVQRLKRLNEESKNA